MIHEFRCHFYRTSACLEYKLKEWELFSWYITTPGHYRELDHIICSLGISHHVDIVAILSPPPPAPHLHPYRI